MPKERSSAAGSIRLANVSNVFSSSGMDTPTEIGGASRIPLDELFPFSNHPFKLYNESRMMEMVESVREHGVLMPILVRPREDGGYEIIAGHNRVEAARQAGLHSIPSTVREMDDDTAIVLMVDSNLRQREQLMPSEKAFAYRMKLEAVKRQAGRPSNNSPQVAANFRSDDEVAKNAGVSGDTIRRFIRLTHLIPPLLERVDANQMAFSPAVAVSYLSAEQQENLLTIMERDEVSPSLEQAEALKTASQSGTLDYEAIHGIMRQEKPNQRKFSISNERLRGYLPDDCTPKQAEEFIFQALDYYKKARQKKTAGTREIALSERMALFYLERG